MIVMTIFGDNLERQDCVLSQREAFGQWTGVPMAAQKRAPVSEMELVLSSPSGRLIYPTPSIPTGRVFPRPVIFPLVRGGPEVYVVPKGRICSVVFPPCGGGLANSIRRLCLATT